MSVSTIQFVCLCCRDVMSHFCTTPCSAVQHNTHRKVRLRMEKKTFIYVSGRERFFFFLKRISLQHYNTNKQLNPHNKALFTSCPDHLAQAKILKTCPFEAIPLHWAVSFYVFFFFKQLTGLRGCISWLEIVKLTSEENRITI